MPRVTLTRFGKNNEVPSHCAMTALYGTIKSSLVAVISVVRGVSLLLSGRPKTALRILCIMAFDTLYTLRNAKRLSKRRLSMLAALLDVGACANAALDNKRCSRHSCSEDLRLVAEAGILSRVIEYLQRLRDLETKRPSHGNDNWRFSSVRSYREGVVRLSLGAVAAASDDQCLDEAIRATDRDPDLSILFRIAMQCQIIDDVVDYSADMVAGLPTFLTSSTSLGWALERTRWVALEQAGERGLPWAGDLFPLRVALFLVSTCTRLVLWLAAVRLHWTGAISSSSTAAESRARYACLAQGNPFDVPDEVTNRGNPSPGAAILESAAGCERG